MPDINARFEEWFSNRFGSLGDDDLTSTFRKVARAAFDEGVRAGSHHVKRLSDISPSRSQFDDTDGSDRPDAPRYRPPVRSTTQFDDVLGHDRPDLCSPSHHRRTTSQFDDVSGIDRPDNAGRGTYSPASSQFSDTFIRR